MKLNDKSSQFEGGTARYTDCFVVFLASQVCPQPELALFQILVFPLSVSELTHFIVQLPAMMEIFETETLSKRYKQLYLICCGYLSLSLEESSAIVTRLTSEWLV